MTLKELKTELLKDSEFKKEYERFDLWFEIQVKWIEMLIIIGKLVEKIRSINKIIK